MVYTKAPSHPQTQSNPPVNIKSSSVSKSKSKSKKPQKLAEKVQRPQTQGQKVRDAKADSNSGNKAPTEQLVERARRMMRLGATTKSQDKKPDKKVVGSGSKARKRKSRRSASKNKDKEGKKTGSPIPHSDNRFKGKYEEVIPLQFRAKKEALEKARLAKANEQDKAKELADKVKLESKRIRRENFYLLREPKPEDRYVDPEIKRKEAERLREKQEAIRKRKEWKAKLDNRRREMGLEFIKSKSPESLREEEKRKKAEKEKSRKQKEQTRRPKSAAVTRKLFANEKIKALLKDAVGSVPPKAKLTNEERLKRKQLVQDQYVKRLIQQSEDEKAKEEQREQQSERLKKLDEDRKIIAERAAARARVKKRSRAETQKFSAGDEEELTVLQLNRWIKEEQGEDPDSEPMGMLARPHSAMDVQQENEGESDEERVEPKGYSGQKSKTSKIVARQHSAVARKAEMLRQQQLEALKSSKPSAATSSRPVPAFRLSNDERERMQARMQSIQDKLRRIETAENVRGQPHQNATMPRREFHQTEKTEHAVGPDPAEQVQTDENAVNDEGVNTESPAAENYGFREPETPQQVQPRKEFSPMTRTESKAGKTRRIVDESKGTKDPEPAQLPGVLHLKEHLRKTRMHDFAAERQAAVTIQRHVRGHLARQGVMKLREQFEGIDEQMGLYSKTSAQPIQFPDFAPMTMKLGAFSGEENDGLSMVDIFMKKNRGLVNRMLNGEEPQPATITTEEVKEEIVKPEPGESSSASKSRTNVLPAEAQKNQPTKTPLKSSLRKSHASVSSSIPEEIESMKDSVTAKKSVGRAKSRDASYISEVRDSEVSPAGEDRSIPEELVKGSQSASVSASASKREPQAAKTSFTEEKKRDSINVVEEAAPDLREKDDEKKPAVSEGAMLEKFIEVTRNMQDRNTEQITTVIDKLCEHLKDLARPTIVQISRDQLQGLDSAPVPPKTLPLPATPAKVPEAETEYAADFEEESGKFSIKGKSQHKVDIEGSIKEEIVGSSAGKRQVPQEIPEEAPEESIQESIKGSATTPAAVTAKGKDESASIEESIVAAEKSEDKEKSKAATPSVKQRKSEDEGIEEVDITDEEREKEQKITGSARVILGSEKAVREQSQRVVEELGGEDKEEKSSDSIFERNSFTDFAFGKFKEILQSNKADAVMKMREDAIKKKYDEKLNELNEEYRKQDISPRTSQRKRKEIERWYKDERHALEAECTHQVMTAIKQSVTLMEQIEKDKERTKQLMRGKEEEEPSRVESIRAESLSDLPELTREVEELQKVRPKEPADKRRKELMQKRLAAEKLITEKQKAIEEGVKDKILKVEEEEADKLFKAAVQIDVSAEIENRAKTAVELLKAKKEATAQKAATPRYLPKPSQQPETRPQTQETKAQKSNEASDSIQEEIMAQSAQSIKESIGKGSLKSSAQKVPTVVPQPEKKPQTKPQAQEVSAEDSVQEDIVAQSVRSIKESLAESKSKDKLSGNRAAAAGADEYSMSYEQESQAEASKRESQRQPQTQTPQPVKKLSMDDGLSDSQSKLYGSSEDVEALAGSDIDWVLTLEASPHAQKQIPIPTPAPQPEEKKQEERKQALPSVQEQREDEEESRHDKQSRKGEGESEIAESYVGEDEVAEEEYPEDFEGSSAGGKTPRDIKGRTVEPESPYSSVDMSLEGSKKELSHTGSGSAQFKISLEKLTKGDEAAKKPVEEKKVSSFDSKAEESVKESISGSAKVISPEDAIKTEETKLAEPTPQAAKVEEKPAPEVKKEPEKTEAEKQLEEEEKQRKKIADMYERKHKADMTKRAEQMTDAIISEVLDGLRAQLFPSRDRPQEAPVAAAVTAPVPTPTTVQLEEKKEPAAKEQKEDAKHHISGIRTALENVEKYIDDVYAEIMKNPEQFVQSLSQSLKRDSLCALGQLQSENADYFAGIEQDVTQPVLPVDLYLEIEHNRKVDSVADQPEDARHASMLTEWSSIHNKCVFDTINDALDYYRPYGIRGPPTPWSKQTRELTFRNGAVSSIREILAAVKSKVMNWAITNAGMLTLPPDKKDSSSVVNSIAAEKIKLDQCREERLEAVLSVEVNESEPNWVNYEQEETQAILDTADMVLEQLVAETLNVVNRIEAERKEDKKDDAN